MQEEINGDPKSHGSERIMDSEEKGDIISSLKNISSFF
jgi:hypothetical protein